jgi:adenosylcobinamide kinase/adenosylcobinamide-phosphate guanylyltransferase
MVSTDITLVIGGARSGKSRFAEKLALQLCDDHAYLPYYVATSQARDAEMHTRIQHHQARRDDRWTTLEEPLQLAELISQYSTPGRVLLVDCLTLWLSNLMEDQAHLPSQTESLQAALKQSSGPVILVSNEVGQGIVPDNKLARDFRDEAGLLNQAIAHTAGTVYFIVAGHPVSLKSHQENI